MPIDKYANIATIDVTQSGTNVLTFQEMTTNLGIDASRKSAIAMLIDEIDYFPTQATIEFMTTSGDLLRMVLAISNGVSDISDITDRRILHHSLFTRFDAGSAANANWFKIPVVYQFFPPLITAERSIFLGLDSVGLGGAGRVRVRIYYRLVTIDQAEFIELAEVFRLVG